MQKESKVMEQHEESRPLCKPDSCPLNLKNPWRLRGKVRQRGLLEAAGGKIG